MDVNQVENKLDMTTSNPATATPGNRPEWVENLITQVSDICKQQKQDSLTLNSINTCNSYMEAKLDEALLEIASTRSTIKSLTKQLESVRSENNSLKKKLIDAETYSKKNNLKFFGIPEMTDEKPHQLMEKLAKVLFAMELNLSAFYIDNIHRLPASGKGPRPVIVKFVSYMDRMLVWNNRYLLTNSDLKVSIREHFSKEMEANIRILLPIRRAAIQQKLKVRLNSDKLYINNQLFTTETLHLLPTSLKPENIAVREIEDHIFFFSGHTPLSNHFPSSFTIEGINYSHSEQYIQSQKAKLFQANEVATNIMKSTNPVEMKHLAAKIPNFNKERWEEHSPQIGYDAILNKFDQNIKIRNILTSTGEKVLVEASPYDKWWGIGLSKDFDQIMAKKSTWGHNLQGQILMKVRSKFVEQPSTLV